MYSIIPSFLLAVASSASAHSIFQELYVNGVSAGHAKGIRVPNYDGPITDVTSSDMACNGGPNPLNTPLPTDIIEVKAGDSVTTEWHHTLSGASAGDAEDPIDASHKGPLMVYLAKVDSALTTSVTGLSWFKIYEDGLDSGTWAVDKLITNKGKLDFKIPSCIQDGNYLLRAELVALHSASSYPGAQFYMECAQINVSGGGTASPSTVKIPGAYSGSDPGITFNLYNNPSSYKIPGPSVFSCDGAATGGSGSMELKKRTPQISVTSGSQGPSGTGLPSGGFGSQTRSLHSCSGGSDSSPQTNVARQLSSITDSSSGSFPTLTVPSGSGFSGGFPTGSGGGRPTRTRTRSRRPSSGARTRSQNVPRQNPTSTAFTTGGDSSSAFPSGTETATISSGTDSLTMPSPSDTGSPATPSPSDTRSPTTPSPSDTGSPTTPSPSDTGSPTAPSPSDTGSPTGGDSSVPISTGTGVPTGGMPTMTMPSGTRSQGSQRPGRPTQSGRRSRSRRPPATATQAPAANAPRQFPTSISFPSGGSRPGGSPTGSFPPFSFSSGTGFPMPTTTDLPSFSGSDTQSGFPTSTTFQTSVSQSSMSGQN